MNESILLSIVIPTYNRITFLETTVENIINQIKAGGLENYVEIIIGNDGSKDKTGEYVDKIKTQYGFVHGFNYEKNIGLSKGGEFLVKESRGPYILISGDDDLLRDGAIAYFIKCLKQKKPNFILINTSNIVSLDDTNHNFKIVLENRLHINKDIFIENFQKDIKLLESAYNWLYLTNLLPSVIFKKDLFEAEEITAKKYLRPENLYLWQAQVIAGISKYGRFLIIGECFVLHRKNETAWTNDSRSIVFFNIFDNEEVANIIKDYMPTEYKKYKKLYAAFTMGGLMLDTLNGKNIRKFAWSAFCRNIFYFPENIQFSSMVIAPKFITKISPRLRALKNKKYFF